MKICVVSTLATQAYCLALSSQQCGGQQGSGLGPATFGFSNFRKIMSATRAMREDTLHRF